MKKLELWLIHLYYKSFKLLGKYYPKYLKHKDSNIVMVIIVGIAMINFLVMKNFILPGEHGVLMIVHVLIVFFITGVAAKVDFDNHPKNSSDNKKISLDLAIVLMAALIVPTIIINGLFMINDHFVIVKQYKVINFLIGSKEG